MDDGQAREPESGVEGALGAGAPMPALDPARYARPEVRRLLVALDIGGLYRLLGQGGGLSQREIARRTGQSQSEVSDIAGGRRRVESLPLLRRMSEGWRFRRSSRGCPGGARTAATGDLRAPTVKRS